MSNHRLFRGKRVDNGEWVKGWLLGEWIVDTDNAIAETDGSSALMTWNDYWEVIPESVGQATGLPPDKCGKDIWEGDIVNSIWQVDHKTKIRGQVKYYSVFALYGLMDNKGDLVSPCWNDCEVIGNITDDKSLLVE